MELNDDRRSATPAELIQRRLDAYNARDIEAFMTCWSPDAELFEHPSKLLARGAARIRQRHLHRFKEPNLEASLVNRLSAKGFWHAYAHAREAAFFGPRMPAEINANL